MKPVTTDNDSGRLFMMSGKEPLLHCRNTACSNSGEFSVFTVWSMKSVFNSDINIMYKATSYPPDVVNGYTVHARQ